MAGMPGFFDVDERLKRLSELGDQLEAYARAVDFEAFRPDLKRARFFWWAKTCSTAAWIADLPVVAPKSPDISHGAAWAAMNSRGERYPSDLCG